MKTFNKDHLPDVLSHAGKEYFLNVAITNARDANNTSLKQIVAELKKQNRFAVLVKCKDKNLSGKKDLHGKPYQAQEFIYTTQAK